MSDIFSKKKDVVLGMLMQGITILFIPFAHKFYQLASISALLGLGTALVYPTFFYLPLHRRQLLIKAKALAFFGFGGLGYAIGAIISGITADLFG
jgi:MFS family permease